jgi:hypothetical protein
MTKRVLATLQLAAVIVSAPLVLTWMVRGHKGRLPTAAPSSGRQRRSSGGRSSTRASGNFLAAMLGTVIGALIVAVLIPFIGRFIPFIIAPPPLTSRPQTRQVPAVQHGEVDGGRDHQIEGAWCAGHAAASWTLTWTADGAWVMSTAPMSAPLVTRCREERAAGQGAGHAPRSSDCGAFPSRGCCSLSVQHQSCPITGRSASGNEE